MRSTRWAISPRMWLDTKTVTPCSPAQRAQQLADLDDAGGVERVGRLVEDEQLGTVQQRPGEGEPLLVAEREHLGAPVGEPAEPQQLDDLGDRRARRPREAALDVEILAHGQVRVGGRGLDEVADAAKAPFAPGCTRLPSTSTSPRGRPDEAEQHADGGRLAGPVPAEKAVDLAAAHVEIEGVDREHVVVALRERACGDGALGAHGRAPW